MDNEQDISLPEGDKEYMQKILDRAGLLTKIHHKKDEVRRKRRRLFSLQAENAMIDNFPSTWIFSFSREQNECDISKLYEVIDGLELEIDALYENLKQL